MSHIYDIISLWGSLEVSYAGEITYTNSFRMSWKYALLFESERRAIVTGCRTPVTDAFSGILLSRH